MADEKLRRGAKTKTEVLLSDIWNKLSALGGGGGGGLATEVTLQSVLSAIQDGQDFEAKIVVDNNGNGTTYLEVRIWNPDTQTWEAPLYYLPGSNVGVPAGSLTPAIVYVNPAALQAQILAAIQAQGTVPQATEATLSAIEAWQSSINTILSVIETETANLDVALSTRATEATLDAINSVNQDILTAAESLDFKIDVATSTRASEATLSAIKTNLDGVLRANLLTRVGAGSTGTVSSARSVSFQNDGSVNATIGGALLYPGQSISISAGGENDTLAPIFYQAGGAGADLLISIIQ